MTTINKAYLESLEQIAQDTGKEFAYDIHAGSWSWFDRDERDNSECWHGGFKSRLDALKDAIEPYLDESDE